MRVKNVVLNRELSRFFDFLTFSMRQENFGFLSNLLQTAFVETRMAYSISDNTIFPAATLEEGDTIRTAFSNVATEEYGGARGHLRDASEALNRGDWAGAVRESVHAVESVTKIIEPRAKTLTEALKKLRGSSKINPNLLRGLEALYNYSSDEDGIRHANVFGEDSNVDKTDAVYMFGACAAFVSFLIARSR